MNTKHGNNGSVLLIAVFAIALLSAVVTGILQLNIEEIQLMRNQIYAAHAMALAEAGLNDAFARLRADSAWTAGFTNKAFNGGTYTVTVAGTFPNLTIESTASSNEGFVARVAADVTLTGNAPHLIRVDNLRINE